MIELMIVVAIIGILAAIAIPNYLKYQAKAKQAEVKSNIKGIYTVETTYFSEHNEYAKDFSDLQWIPVGPYRYAYNIGGTNAGLNLPLSLAKNNDPPGADQSSFTAVAWGNIDADFAVDTWQATTNGGIKNTYDDVVETQP